jgi:hypothetical protein
MFRAELRNIILSSIALQSLFNRSSITHQLLFNGSSNAHQTLIKHSSNAHQTLIFFRILYALPKSPRVILRALCGYASYCTSAYVLCAVYLMAGTFQHDITVPLLLLPTEHRLTAAKLGTSRLRGGSGLGNRLGRTLCNAFNVMSTC